MRDTDTAGCCSPTASAVHGRRRQETVDGVQPRGPHRALELLMANQEHQGDLHVDASQLVAFSGRGAVPEACGLLQRHGKGQSQGQAQEGDVMRCRRMALDWCRRTAVVLEIWRAKMPSSAQAKVRENRKGSREDVEERRCCTSHVRSRSQGSVGEHTSMSAASLRCAPWAR